MLFLVAVGLKLVHVVASVFVRSQGYWGVVQFWREERNSVMGDEHDVCYEFSPCVHGVFYFYFRKVALLFSFFFSRRCFCYLDFLDRSNTCFNGEAKLVVHVGWAFTVFWLSLKSVTVCWEMTCLSRILVKTSSLVSVSFFIYAACIRSFGLLSS